MGRKPKVTKQREENRQRLREMVDDWLVEIGAEMTATGMFHVETTLGRLYIRAVDDHIACRFTEPRRAVDAGAKVSRGDGLGAILHGEPVSLLGYWNHGDLAPEEPVALFTRFRRSLGRILPCHHGELLVDAQNAAVDLIACPNCGKAL